MTTPKTVATAGEPVADAIDRAGTVEWRESALDANGLVKYQGPLYAKQEAPQAARHYVVPLEATPAMLDALDHAMPGQYKIGRAEAKKIWKAVVAAAPFHCIDTAPQAGDADALLRDAERYRWLRDNTNRMTGKLPIVVVAPKSYVAIPRGKAFLDGGIQCAETLDAAIDACLGQSKP